MVLRLLAYPCAALVVAALSGTGSVAWGASPPPLIVDAAQQVATPSGIRPVARDVLVKFAPGTAPRTQRPARSRVLDAAGAQPRGARAVPGLPGVWRVPVDAGAAPRRVALRLDARRDVEWAAPNTVARVNGVPNDPLFGNLWGLVNTGQAVLAPRPFTGIAGIDIGALGAWSTVRGSPDVRVAVMDSGIDMRHPDLAANLRTEGARNFVPDVDGVVDPGAVDDANDHGTHVAGTIGAVGNNALGVTGVNWTVGMVPVRACNFAGACGYIPEGLAHAGRVSRVVNASLGGPMESPDPSTEAIGRSPNTLFVVAAGNDGPDADNDVTPQDPCNVRLPNVLCVAALDADGELAEFSNYGANSVHIAAPGVGIQSSVPAFATVFDPGMRSDGATPARPLGWTEERIPAGGTPAWQWFQDPGGSPYIRLPRPTPVAPLTTWTITAPGSFALAGDSCQMNTRVWIDLQPGAQALALAYRAPGDAMPTPLPQSALNGDSGRDAIPWSVDLSGLIGRSGLELVFLVESVAGVDAGLFVDIAEPTVKCVVGQPRAGTYAFLSGTSMATPMVAGAAALLLAKNPDLTAVQVKDAILSTAVRMESLRGKVITGGRLDVNAALAAVPARPVAPDPPAQAGRALALRVGSGIAVRPPRWRARVPVTCEQAPPARCTVTVALRMRVARAGNRPARWVAQGTRPVSLPGGWRGVVDVGLTRQGRQLLQRHARVRTTVIVAGRGESAGLVPVRQSTRLIRR